MNPFVTRLSTNSIILPLSAMMIILGVLLSVAWIPETRTDRVATLDPDQRQRLGSYTVPGAQENEKLQERLIQLQATVEDLQKNKTRLENAIAEEGDKTKVLNENLQDTKVLAGLTEVEGPGVVVTLRDLSDVKKKIDTPKEPSGFSPMDDIIHDFDVLRTMNELWNAGAEAVAVGGNRIVSRTSIRCVGSVIHVNDQPVSSPIVIQAIGDPKILASAMNLKGGVLQDIRDLEPGMISVEPAKLIRLPAYTGPTTRKFVTLPKDSEQDKGKDKGSK